MATPVADAHVPAPAPRGSTEAAQTTSSEKPAQRERWRRPVIPRALVMLVGAGAAVLVLAGVRSVAWLVGPAFLALIIGIALNPVQRWLRRKGWPAWLTTLVLVLLVVGVLVAFGLVVVVSLAKLAGVLQQNTGNAE